MDKFNAYGVLSGITSTELMRVSDQLNRTGFATDEDGLCLGSLLIEHWTDACTALIEQHGYNGGELAMRGDFFGGVGAIYVLYDKTRHTENDAVEELQRVADHGRD